MHVTRTGNMIMTYDIMNQRIQNDEYGPDDRGQCLYDFHDDLRAYLLTSGVPEQYVSKVAYAAWERGHSAGMHEVLSEAADLVAIFT